MGCTASVRERDGAGGASPIEVVGEENADDFVRKVSETIQPIRVSSRNLTPEDLFDQRSRARSDEIATTASGHLALETNASRSSFRPVGSLASAASRVSAAADDDDEDHTPLGVPLPRRSRVSSRISTLLPDVRRRFLSGIREMHEKGNGKSESLEGRLQTFGLRMKEMEGDGNCQFRTLAFNLFGEQSHHATARKAAVAHMKKHQDFFGVLFESADEFKNYLRDMAKNRTWGDELTLRAVVEAYGVEAHVITSEPANWYLVYQPEENEQLDPQVAACPKGVKMPKPGKQVFLSYISPVHYNSIVVSKPASE